MDPNSSVDATNWAETYSFGLAPAKIEGEPIVYGHDYILGKRPKLSWISRVTEVPRMWIAQRLELLAYRIHSSPWSGD